MDRDLRQLLDAALTADTLRPDDIGKIRAIISAPDHLTTLTLLGAYYRDPDRADRTPRELIYLHLGLLMGCCEKLISEKSENCSHLFEDGGAMCLRCGAVRKTPVT